GAAVAENLGESGDGYRAARPLPGGAALAAALVQPGREQLPCAPGQRYGVDLAALAVQADLAGASGDREVLGVGPGAFLDAGARVQQHGDDCGVAGATAQGCAANCAFLPGSERVGLTGPGDAGALDGYADAG